MKRILTGLAAGGLMLAGAGAALGDGPAYTSVKDVPHHEHFTWSGFYGGLSVGGMSSKIKGNFQNAPGFFWDSGKQSDAVAGLHGGYQHQFGSFVLGLEGGYKSVLSNKFSSKIAGGASTP